MSSKFIDPYKVLGIDYSDDLDTIREKFKKLVLKVHPDRGGNTKDFQLVKNAYAYVYKHKKKMEKQLNNEKRDIKEFKEELSTDMNNVKDTLSKNLKATGLNPKAVDMSKFNEIFQKVKVKDAYDDGAGDFMKQDVKPEKLQIAVVEDPLSATGMAMGNVRELGVETVSDFSSFNIGKRGDSRNCQTFDCTDVRMAYQNREIIEGNMKNVREESFLSKGTSVDSLVRKRSVIPEMDPREMMRQSMRQQEEIAAEELRRYRAHKQDEMVARQFNNFANYLTYRKQSG